MKREKLIDSIIIVQNEIWKNRKRNVNIFKKIGPFQKHTNLPLIIIC